MQPRTALLGVPRTQGAPLLGDLDPPPGPMPARAGSRTLLGFSAWCLCAVAVPLGCLTSPVDYLKVSYFDGPAWTFSLVFFFFSAARFSVFHSAFRFVCRYLGLLDSLLSFPVVVGVLWGVPFFCRYSSGFLVPLFPGW